MYYNTQALEHGPFAKRYLIQDNWWIRQNNGY
jgi:hypothetical protein